MQRSQPPRGDAHASVGAGTAPVIGMLHPGTMGAAVAAQARHHGVSVVWDPTDRSRRTCDRARDADLMAATDLGDLLARAQIVICICPPAAAEPIACQVADHGYSGVYVDANAISPRRMNRIAALVGANHARVIDGAIIGPPPTLDVSSTLYLAGDPAAIADITAVFTDTHLATMTIGDRPGAASGLKCAYASYQKATQALAALAYALAAHHDVTDPLSAEATRRRPDDPLARSDQIRSAAAKAWRWQSEFGEIADALADADLPDDLARAAASVMSAWADAKDQRLPLGDLLQRLHHTPAR